MMRKLGLIALTALFVGSLAMPAVAGCMHGYTQQSMADSSTNQSTSSTTVIVGTDGD